MHKNSMKKPLNFSLATFLSSTTHQNHSHLWIRRAYNSRPIFQQATEDNRCFRLDLKMQNRNQNRNSVSIQQLCSTIPSLMLYRFYYLHHHL